jgi:hypothetical protein
LALARDNNRITVRTAIDFYNKIRAHDNFGETGWRLIRRNKNLTRNIILAKGERGEKFFDGGENQRQEAAPPKAGRF